MVIIKISASYSIKKQVRQYEPISISAGAEATVTEDEDILTAQQELFKAVKVVVANQMGEAIKEFND